MLFMLGCLTGVLLSCWLVFFNPNQRYSSCLLGYAMIVYALICLHVFLIETTLIRELPFLFRFTKPLLYLPGVFLFLYTRSVLFGEQGPRPADAILFLPSGVQLVLMVPFFLMDRERKMGYIDFFISNNQFGIWQQEGLLPPYVFSAALICFSLTMLWLTARLLLKAATEGRSIPIRQNHAVFNWLFLYFSMNLLLTLTLLLNWSPAGSSSAHTLLQVNILEVALLLLAVASVLAKHPNILFGFQGRMPLHDHEPPLASGLPVLASFFAPGRSGPFDEAQVKACMSILEKTILADALFRNRDLGLADLSGMTGIAEDRLVAAINREYGTDFNTYINRFRVEYAKELIHMSGPAAADLERVSHMAGFNSAEQLLLAFPQAEGAWAVDHS